MRKEVRVLQLFFRDISEISEDEFRKAYLLMTPQRKERCRRLCNEKAQKQCIAADLLMREALSSVLKIAPEEITVCVAPSGKPYLEGNPVYFSLSHSEDRIVCAVADHPVGVDIERCRPVSPGIMNRICTPAESEYLSASTSKDDRVRRFLLLWTRKEAVFKIDGRLPRKDAETEVLNPDENLSVTTEFSSEYVFSVAIRNIF